MSDDEFPDEFPPEWLDQAPEPDWDTSPFAPDVRQDATAIALYNAYVDDTPENFERMLLDYCRDLLRDKTAPAAVWALVAYGASTLTDAQGRDPTIARIRQDLSVAREEAIEEYEANEGLP